MIRHYGVTIYLLEPTFHSGIIVQYKEHYNIQMTWTCYADTILQLNYIQGKTKLHTHHRKKFQWQNDSFNVCIILQDLFWKEVHLILIVSITAIGKIHLLKCGWCLATMYASFPYYIYKIVETIGKICSDFICIFLMHNFGIVVVTEGIMKLLTNFF
jgi:hypothetical protein